MPDFDINVDFEVYCGSCNEGLCNNSNTGKTRGRGMFFVSVNPCEKCLKNAAEEAQEKIREEYEALLEEARLENTNANK